MLESPGKDETMFSQPAKKGATMTKTDRDLFVARLSSTERYSQFRQVLDKKCFNEAAARKIAQNMTASTNPKDGLRKIFELVDKQYTVTWDGTMPWFGRLIKSNTSRLPKLVIQSNKFDIS
jgi:hypothetical protein